MDGIFVTNRTLKDTSKQTNRINKGIVEFLVDLCYYSSNNPRLGYKGGYVMKISTKGRYALRLMLDLALNNTGEYITIKSIAARQEISEKYLEQIISLLNRAGYVKSVRGAQGGYKLAKEPVEYTVGMILRLTEGSLSPIDCLDDDTNDCSRCNRCVTKDVWKELYDAICNVVDNITLQNLVEKQLNMVPFDFSI